MKMIGKKKQSQDVKSETVETVEETTSKEPKVEEPQEEKNVQFIYVPEWDTEVPVYTAKRK